MQSVVNGIGIGFFTAFFISLYVDTFIGVILPVFITYFILAPLFSAISIVFILYSKKEQKRKAGIDWWEDEGKSIKTGY